MIANTAAGVLETQGVACALLFRIRPKRKLRGAPPPYAGHGRAATHGALLRLSDPTTWPPPDEAWEVVDEKLGPLQIQRWDKQHFEDAPDRPCTLLRVERRQARKTRRDPGVIWLGYGGASPLPTQSELWRAYLSRYVIEHWYRLLKQSLHWTLPQLSTPQQSALWSTLLVAASWELWLARGAAPDAPRPWQKPQAPEKMTPGRVQQGRGAVLAGIGTPADAPKPRGKSPGWPAGRVRAKRTRCAVIKKTARKASDTKKTAATAPAAVS